MISPNLTPESPEVSSRLEHIGYKIAASYVDSFSRVNILITADGRCHADSLRDLDRFTNSQLELAFIGDAIARIKPIHHGDPELLWVPPAKSLVRGVSPGLELTCFLANKNEAEQKEIYREMWDHVVDLDEGELTSPWYTCRVAFGRTILRLTSDDVTDH